MNVFMALVQYTVPGEVFLTESGPGQKTLNTIGYCTLHTTRNWTLDSVPFIPLETGPWILYPAYYQKLDPGYCTLHTLDKLTRSSILLDTVPCILQESGSWILLDNIKCTLHTAQISLHIKPKILQGGLDPGYYWNPDTILGGLEPEYIQIILKPRYYIGWTGPCRLLPLSTKNLEYYPGH